VKLHDLKPAPGSTKRRIRVGRGIAAGKGKTAGRGTKGQKSRSGASIPGWFEGGQTPVHVRVPKLRGFKRRGRIEYQVVNVGRISEYALAGRFGAEAGSEPLTVNGEVLAAAGLISHADRPIKVLGAGDIEVKVFVAADAFTASARSKIEAAGGFVQALKPQPAPAEPEPATEPESEPVTTSAPEPEPAPVSAPAAEVAAVEPDGSDISDDQTATE
jgi:large subunit ribosomal protein L15